MECFLRATSPDACRNFLVTARFFRFHRDCGKIEIWCWGSDRDGISRCSICVAGWGWDLPVLHRVFFPFFFFGRPGSRPMRSNRNLTFDRQRRRNINGTNWPVYYILCLMFFFFFFFSLYRAKFEEGRSISVKFQFCTILGSVFRSG